MTVGKRSAGIGPARRPGGGQETLPAGARSVEVAGEHFILLPQKAIYWPRCSTLLVADAHWGKPAAFRASSIPIPEGSLRDDLARLSGALRQTGARRLILLGDMMHAREGWTVEVIEQLRAWRRQHADLEVTLVRGNHDYRAGDPPPELGIRCADAPLHEPPFLLQHLHQPAEGSYVLAGHVHPAVRLHGAARQRLKMPCFYFGKDRGLLPAFGSFTGMALIRPRPGDQVYVVAGDMVLAAGAGPDAKPGSELP